MLSLDSIFFSSQCNEHSSGVGCCPWTTSDHDRLSNLPCGSHCCPRTTSLIGQPVSEWKMKWISRFRPSPFSSALENLTVLPSLDKKHPASVGVSKATFPLEHQRILLFRDNSHLCHWSRLTVSEAAFFNSYSLVGEAADLSHGVRGAFCYLRHWNWGVGAVELPSATAGVLW